MEVAMSSQVAEPRGHYREKTAAAIAHATRAASISFNFCGSVLWHMALYLRSQKRRQSQEGYGGFYNDATSACSFRAANFHASWRRLCVGSTMSIILWHIYH